MPDVHVSVFSTHFQNPSVSTGNFPHTYKCGLCMTKLSFDPSLAWQVLVLRSKLVEFVMHLVHEWMYGKFVLHNPSMVLMKWKYCLASTGFLSASFRIFSMQRKNCFTVNLWCRKWNPELFVLLHLHRALDFQACFPLWEMRAWQIFSVMCKTNLWCRSCKIITVSKQFFRTIFWNKDLLASLIAGIMRNTPNCAPMSCPIGPFLMWSDSQDWSTSFIDDNPMVSRSRSPHKPASCFT